MQISKALLRRAVAALRDAAHMEAGTSQAPDLIQVQDTQAWEDAKTLDAWLREHGKGAIDCDDIEDDENKNDRPE